MSKRFAQAMVGQLVTSLAPLLAALQPPAPPAPQPPAQSDAQQPSAPTSAAPAPAAAVVAAPAPTPASAAVAAPARAPGSFTPEWVNKTTQDYKTIPGYYTSGHWNVTKLAVPCTRRLEMFTDTARQLGCYHPDEETAATILGCYLLACQTDPEIQKLGKMDKNVLMNVVKDNLKPRRGASHPREFLKTLPEQPDLLQQDPATKHLFDQCFTDGAVPVRCPYPRSDLYTAVHSFPWRMGKLAKQQGAQLQQCAQVGMMQQPMPGMAMQQGMAMMQQLCMAMMQQRQGMQDVIPGMTYNHPGSALVPGASQDRRRATPQSAGRDAAVALEAAGGAAAAEDGHEAAAGAAGRGDDAAALAAAHAAADLAAAPGDAAAAQAAAGKRKSPEEAAESLLNQMDTKKCKRAEAQAKAKAEKAEEADSQKKTAKAKAKAKPTPVKVTCSTKINTY